MIPTLALAAALGLAPSQPAAGALSLKNVRVTYGELGAPRTDDKLLPGDLYFIAFDIEGIKVDDTGKVSYSMAMVVTDKNNKPIFNQEPANRDEHIPLGGSKLPARAYIAIGLDQESGTYTCKVTVTDRVSKAAQTLTKTFDVLPKGFGVVSLFTSVDAKGEIPAPPVGVIGQNVFVQFAVVGFGRDKAKKPDLTVEMRLLDEARKPTLPKAETLVIKETQMENDPAVPLTLPIPFNREGNFTVELKATDKLTGKEATARLPIRVTPLAVR
jgi:hypothetical protein